jgi:hypothetical protein
MVQPYIVFNPHNGVNHKTSFQIETLDSWRQHHTPNPALLIVQLPVEKVRATDSIEQQRLNTKKNTERFVV